MPRFLWPLGVVVAFALGLGIAGVFRDVWSTAPAADHPQALVHRLREQVSTLQARLRVSEAKLAGQRSATTGHAAASLGPQLAEEPRPAGSGEGIPRAGRSARRGGSPQGEPQDDFSSSRRAVRSAAVVAPTVDGALERFYRYLGEVSGTGGPQRWQQMREVAADLRAMGDAGMEALARVLANGTSSDERRAAAQLLGDLQDPRALPVLRDILDKDSDVLLRRAAAAGLRRLESPETVPVLEALLGNAGEDRFVRMSAAYGLAQLGRLAGVSGLTQIFDEANVDGRGRDVAFRALRSLDDDRSLPFMRQLVTSGAELSYRLQAIQFLEAHGDRQSLGALERIMQSPTEQPSIRDAATRAHATIASR
jgi:HEAT repeat protein